MLNSLIEVTRSNAAVRTVTCRRNGLRNVIFVGLILASFAAVSPASAELFTIEMKNGNELLSRYRPQRADWDENTILVLTDVGNWVAVPEELIVDVTAETETQGFGKVISTTTIELGFAPNDNADPNVKLEGSDPVADALRTLAGGGSNGQPMLDDFATQQFVEPGRATGIPGSVIGSGLGTPISGDPVEPN